jgi:hypothetical protein
MDENIEGIERKLRDLCIDVIDILNKLKEEGVIEEAEYQKHTHKKKDFLNNTLH